MASAPPNPLPQSIVLSNFAGIKNTVDERRLGQGELASAVNIDLDDAGMVRRRRGQTKKLDDPCHSLKTLGDITLVVRAGMLCVLNPDYTTRALSVAIGRDPLSYVRVADTIYYSSRTMSAKLVNLVPQPWGTPGAGQWISPVLRPTETLGAISGKLLTAPPRATILETYKGRIFMADGPVVWATELFLFDLVDATRNFIQFEHDVTMLAAVEDGLYVGTAEELVFLSGVFSTGMKRTTVIGAGVIPGSMVWVPYSKVDPRARGGQPMPEGEGPVVMTTAGVMLLMEGGQVYNLTQDRIVFPDAVNAAALYREDRGVNSYVAVTDSAGSPSANARIGDYVDAEIVRASERG